jgi:hypothetical protein
MEPLEIVVSSETRNTRNAELSDHIIRTAWCLLSAHVPQCKKRTWATLIEEISSARVLIAVRDSLGFVCHSYKHTTLTNTQHTLCGHLVLRAGHFEALRACVAAPVRYAIR